MFVQLLSSHHNLDECLKRWHVYEESQKIFMEWLLEADDVLKKDLELKATLNEKEARVEQYQVIYFVV